MSQPDLFAYESPSVSPMPVGARAAEPAGDGPESAGASSLPPVPPAVSSASSLPPMPVEVRRSTKRRKTVSAYQEGNKLVVAIPASMSKAQEREWVLRMSQQMASRQAKRRPSDDALYQRALILTNRYLGGQAQPASVQWTANQDRRWGSCSVNDKAIRISDRARGMPEYVLDYLLLHELTHLLHAGHGPAFWAHLADYPHLEKARGFLDGAAFAGQ